MKIDKFEDILSWQKGRDLANSIYTAYEKSNDFGFKNQIERASVSIMNNIAEGFERKSNKEFRQYLFIAKGSCGEVRSMLYLAQDLGKINKNEFNSFYNPSLEISKLLSGLIKTL
jgi:four helix bundle protein